VKRYFHQPQFRLLYGFCLGLLMASAAVAQDADDFTEESFQDPYEVRDELEEIFASPEFRRINYERSDAEITDSDIEPIKLPDWLEGAASALGSVLGPSIMFIFWVLLAAVCILIIYLIFSAFSSPQKVKKTEGWLEDDYEEGEGELSPGELSADVYLNRADEFAASGNLREAIAQLQLGAMSSIEREGLIRFRRGLTCRDYLRAARPRETWHAALREIVRIYEPICFGRRAAEREHYDALLNQYLGAFHAT